MDGANGGNSSKEPAEPSVAISPAAAALLRPRATADSWVILIKKNPLHWLIARLSRSGWSCRGLFLPASVFVFDSTGGGVSTEVR